MPTSGPPKPRSASGTCRRIAAITSPLPARLDHVEDFSADRLARNSASINLREILDIDEADYPGTAWKSRTTRAELAMAQGSGRGSRSSEPGRHLLFAEQTRLFLTCDAVKLSNQ